MAVPQMRRPNAKDGERSIFTPGLVRNALIVFAIALAVRWITDVVLQPHLGSYVMDYFDVMGENILRGRGFSLYPDGSVPTVTRAPFYPSWWALELALFGRNYLLLRMGEGLVDAITAGLIVFMTTALMRLPVGRDALPTTIGDSTLGESPTLLIPTLAGAIYAVQPFPAYYYAKMGTESWFTFWLVLLMWAYAAWLLAPGYRRGILLGLATGMLLLNKSTAMILVPILALIGIVWLGGRRRLACVSLVLCFFVAGVMIMPWIVRNYRVTEGRFVAIQTLTWWNFWADFDFSPSGYLHAMDGLYEPGGGMPYGLSAEADVRQEAHLRYLAAKWMREHPLGMARKMGTNLLEFWYLVEGVHRARIVAIVSVVEIAAAVVGAGLAWRERRWRLLVLVVGLILYFNVIYTPMKAVFHYSLVTVPFLSLLQAFLAAWVYSRFKARSAQSGVSKHNLLAH